MVIVVCLAGWLKGKKANIFDFMGLSNSGRENLLIAKNIFRFPSKTRKILSPMRSSVKCLSILDEMHFVVEFNVFLMSRCFFIDGAS